MTNSKDTFRRLATAAVLLGTAMSVSSVFASSLVDQVYAGWVYRQTYYLYAGTQYTFETTNLSPNSDTVMHLWSVDSGSQVPGGFDDDSGAGHASKITYTPTATGSFTVVVMARTDGPTGTCNLVIKAGSTVIENTTTTFNRANISPPGFDANDIVETVLMGGAGDTFIYVVDTGGTKLVAMDDDSGLGFASRYQMPAASMNREVVIGTFGPYEEGMVNVIVNDKLSNGDQDNDGLGTGLEQKLCTCDTSSGTVCAATLNVDCSTVQNSQDTDGDGLWDDWEVIGKADTTGIYPDQTLVKWGANPLRMDLFVQLNRLTVNGVTPPAMVLTQATKIATRFMNLDTVSNLDGSTGIYLHIDGGPPGSDSVLLDMGFGGAVVPGDRTYAFQNEASYFPSSRKEVFFWAVAEPGCGGGGAAWSWPTRISFGLTGVTANACDDVSGASLAHEIGHAVGLGHGGGTQGGTPNGAPAYPSLMNYAYAFSYKGDFDRYFDHLQFSAGSMPQLDNLALNELAILPGDITFLTKFPYFYSTSGNKVDWNRDGQFDNSVKAMFSPPPLVWGPAAEQVAHQKESLSPPLASSGLEIASFVRNSAEVMYLIQADSSTGKVRYTYTSQDSGGWAAWSTSPVSTAGLRGGGATLATARTSLGGSDSLLVLAASSDGRKIVQYTLSTSGGMSGPQYVTTPAATNGVKDLSAVAFGNKAYAFYRDMNSPDTDARVYMGACSAPLCSWSSFSVFNIGSAPLKSKVTPGVTTGPAGSKVYLLAAEYDISVSPPVHRTQLYGSTAPGTSWAKLAVTWQDENRGRPSADLGRRPIDSRPAFLFSKHLLGGSGTTPLPNDRGYLMAWWRNGEHTELFLTEGMLSTTTENFSVGNFRYMYPAGTDASASTSPSATLFKGRAHLVTWSELGFDHFPNADGLSPSGNVHRDTSDGIEFRNNLCEVLKFRCPEQCIIDRNHVCSPHPEPDFESCEALAEAAP